MNNTCPSSTQVLERLEAEDVTNLERIGANAQSFAQRYLTQFSKALYFSKAVEMYNRHFPGLQAFVSTLSRKDLSNIHTVVAAMKLRS